MTETQTETKTYAGLLREYLADPPGSALWGAGSTTHRDKLAEVIAERGLAEMFFWSSYLTDALAEEMKSAAVAYLAELAKLDDDDDLFRRVDRAVIHGDSFGISSGMGGNDRAFDLVLDRVTSETRAAARQAIVQAAEFALASLVRTRFADDLKAIRATKDSAREMHGKVERARSDETKAAAQISADAFAAQYAVAKADLSLAIDEFVATVDLPAIVIPDSALDYMKESL